MRSSLDNAASPSLLQNCTKCPCKFASGWEKISNLTSPWRFRRGSRSCLVLREQGRPLCSIASPGWSGRTQAESRPTRRSCSTARSESMFLRSFRQSGLCVSGPGAVSPPDRRGQRRVRAFAASAASNAGGAVPPFWSRSASHICARAGRGRFPAESGRESRWPAPW